MQQKGTADSSDRIAALEKEITALKGKDTQSSGDEDTFIDVPMGRGQDGSAIVEQMTPNELLEYARYGKLKLQETQLQKEKPKQEEVTEKSFTELSTEDQITRLRKEKEDLQKQFTEYQQSQGLKEQISQTRALLDAEAKKHALVQQFPEIKPELDFMVSEVMKSNKSITLGKAYEQVVKMKMDFAEKILERHKDKNSATSKITEILNPQLRSQATIASVEKEGGYTADDVKNGVALSKLQDMMRTLKVLESE